MIVVVLVVAGLIAFGLIVRAGTRMVQHPDGSGGGVAHALGPLVEIFDPARARADQELESRRHQGSVSPTPEGDEPPVRVDLKRGTVRIRRP
ncbi:hypothetical protein P5P86_03000 [Nocardioides sp. BP30]|uniref:hypothetical protein n=1 Tax=Nocardioides sp. BP30 TaxID=3036374 RepID=UPI002469B45A|nr:hypothetical protein [Nocardioides sp. BP30]WGL52796.1 hypothetical protein P5P86_03000 [Nocardioides sp. BP30]